MPVDFPCGCGKWLRVEDQYAGTQVKCPYCGKVLAVPSAPPVLPAVMPGGFPRRAGADSERFRTISMASLWLGIIGTASGVLFFIIGLVAAASAQSHRYGYGYGGGGPSPALGIFALLLILVGAATSITGLILGAKGLNAENTRYKPHAIGGLVTGIIGTCIVGCILGCMLIGFAAFLGR